MTLLLKVMMVQSMERHVYDEFKTIYPHIIELIVVCQMNVAMFSVALCSESGLCLLFTK